MLRRMPEPTISKSGDAQIVKVGHTVGTKYGTNPSAKERGASNPTPISFNR